MNRREALGAIGAVGLVAIAGCTAGEDGTFVREASPAEIPPAVVNEYGYTAQGPESIELNETFEVAGISREVRVTTWVASYQSNGDVLTVLSTPNVTVAGESLNPLARLSGADLITRLADEGLDRFGGPDASVRDIEADGETSVTVLGKDAAIEEYTAVIEVEDEPVANDEGDVPSEIPVRLYLLSVVHGEDVIFSLGAHEQGNGSNDAFYAMMESIEHEAAGDESGTGTETA